MKAAEDWHIHITADAVIYVSWQTHVGCQMLLEGATDTYGAFMMQTALQFQTHQQTLCPDHLTTGTPVLQQQFLLVMLRAGKVSDIDAHHSLA